MLYMRFHRISDAPVFVLTILYYLLDSSQSWGFSSIVTKDIASGFWGQKIASLGTLETTEALKGALG